MPGLKEEIDIFMDSLHLLGEQFPDDVKDIKEIMKGSKSKECPDDVIICPPSGMSWTDYGTKWK